MQYTQQRISEVLRRRRMGFTGTREGMTDHQNETFENLLVFLNPSEFHHGDCVGSDAEASNLVRQLVNIEVHVHPPLDQFHRAWTQGYTYSHPPAPYLERDRRIVDMTDYLVATPKSHPYEPRKGGTWYTIEYAMKPKNAQFALSTPIIIIWPHPADSLFDVISWRTPKAILDNQEMIKVRTAFPEKDYRPKFS